jgi:hypothetical protein
MLSKIKNNHNNAILGKNERIITSFQ